MIKSLLIANRGEIAARIIRTCQQLQIRTVAVYSKADRHSQHVSVADAAYCIGPAESSASYLNSEAIITVAKQAGVDAIHPGYGFLSESEALISLCEREGITFIGPNREAIRLMGSKQEAKQLAQQIGVPVIPGYHGSDQSESTLSEQARVIGFPLMIKASAGGGGKGMRQVAKEDDFSQALKEAKQEALIGFGDDTVLLEKLVTAPRHIEVQIAGDKQGNTVHLYERECSIQRNHQKIIEEAPAAFITDTQRHALFEAALKLARSIHYDSLGTVEFLLDNLNGEFYFLEMNTRLQVEHPVTEYITGLDLVEWQIRIAAGESLPLPQAEITQTGWAIEARINAEDPANNYQPQTGLIRLYREPTPQTASYLLRIDSAVRQGDTITPFYDSMIAKVISHGDNRERARIGLLDAVSTFRISGITTNLAFIADILRQNAFRDSALTTSFLDSCFPSGWKPVPVEPKTLLLSAIAYTAVRESRVSPETPQSPWQSLGSFRVLANAGITADIRLTLSDSHNHTHFITVNRAGNNYRALLDDEEIQAQALILPNGECLIEHGSQSHSLRVAIEDRALTVSSKTDVHHWTLLDNHHLALSSSRDDGSGDHRIVANLPGQIVELHCQPGDHVKAGDTLVVLDSMKLLHKLCAPANGTVEAVFCAIGDNVDNAELLVELDLT